MEELEKLLEENRPFKCEKCGGRMTPRESGRYECLDCGEEAYDDFGKVKKFLEEKGAAPIIEISRATGVPHNVIEMFLKKGKIEIPEGSAYYLSCERCGCSIRYGRFCPECTKELASGIQAIFNEDMGERARENLSGDGRMHYLDK